MSTNRMAFGRLLLLVYSITSSCVALSSFQVGQTSMRKTISSVRLMSSTSDLTTNDTGPATTKTSNNNALVVEKPKKHYDSLIAGGGPAGLMTAIMLSQKFGPSHSIGVCERRSAKPPSPSDDSVWNDIARFYLLGIGHRGQSCLRKFGVYDDFVKASVQVNGRRDWQPGQSREEDGKITPSRKGVPSRVLARDKLVGVLHHHILEKYANASIDLLYGYEVDPVSFGEDDDDKVTVQINKCQEKEKEDLSYKASQDSEETCDVDNSMTTATTNLLVGADGSARTIANSMEQYEGEKISRLSWIRRPFARRKQLKVTRFVDDNPRVFKSIPIRLPSHWPCDLNYSARSARGVTLEALPSDNNGGLCALLLMKPDDKLAQPNVKPEVVRAFFDEEFPQFSPLVNDEEIARVAAKPSSSLPAFRFVGPKLHFGGRTVLLGDACHTVKPYYGLGANSALEDVEILSEALDEAALQENGIDSPTKQPSSGEDGSAPTSRIPYAVRLFSRRRSKDAEALVTMSRNLDRPGKLFVLNFILPLILDGIFHKFAPRIFGPNMFGMFAKEGMGFKQIQRKKRLDRALQVSCITGLMAVLGWGTFKMARLLAGVILRSVASPLAAV